MRIDKLTRPPVVMAAELNEEALDCLDTLAEYLLEYHADELDSAHGGDSEEAGYDPENCSYCEALAKAWAILQTAGRE